MKKTPGHDWVVKAVWSFGCVWDKLQSGDPSPKSSPYSAQWERLIWSLCLRPRRPPFSSSEISLCTSSTSTSFFLKIAPTHAQNNHRYRERRALCVHFDRYVQRSVAKKQQMDARKASERANFPRSRFGKNGSRKRTMNEGGWGLRAKRRLARNSDFPGKIWNEFACRAPLVKFATVSVVIGRVFAPAEPMETKKVATSVKGFHGDGAQDDMKYYDANYSGGKKLKPWISFKLNMRTIDSNLNYKQLWQLFSGEIRQRKPPDNVID